MDNILYYYHYTLSAQTYRYTSNYFAMTRQLELCRYGVRFLALLMTKDNKDDYDQLQKHTCSHHAAYMERASKRAQIYQTLRMGLLDHIMMNAWTTTEQVYGYLQQSYFELLDQALGDVRAKV